MKPRGLVAGFGARDHVTGSVVGRIGPRAADGLDFVGRVDRAGLRRALIGERSEVAQPVQAPGLVVAGLDKRTAREVAAVRVGQTIERVVEIGFAELLSSRVGQHVLA